MLQRPEVRHGSWRDHTGPCTIHAGPCVGSECGAASTSNHTNRDMSLHSTSTTFFDRNGFENTASFYSVLCRTLLGSSGCRPGTETSRDAMAVPDMMAAPEKHRFRAVSRAGRIALPTHSEVAQTNMQAPRLPQVSAGAFDKDHVPECISTSATFTNHVWVALCRIGPDHQDEAITGLR